MGKTNISYKTFKKKIMFHKKINKFKTEKYKTTAELFKQRANQYTLLFQWENAADAFINASHVYIKLHSMYNSAMCLSKAGVYFAKCGNFEKAVLTLTKCVDILTNDSQLCIAAENAKYIAELYERDLSDTTNAIAFYQKAADLYDSTNSETTVCQMKIADISMSNGDYPHAIEVYEKIAKVSLDNNTLQGIYFKSGICYVALGDYHRAEKQIELYANQDPTFSDSRECTFLTGITRACINNDIDEFMNTVSEYDKVSRLSDTIVKTLLCIKNSINHVDIT